ncbi:FeoA family protein [Vibrio tapetis]|uniref:FeoA domain superfamily protein n=1 Tax=Vibrio tapetis subsp. tapetis TaxID=1671868 RepID=A0A2N8ZBE9_9VIBR|nr:FeoA family protein [Vibrio tapetis]SON49236.1 FeoA domain superfamily protein [Vibrio tapetis subsp. tapetis]
MTLSELKDGEKALVSNFSTLTLETRKKLMVMGVLPNTELTVVRRAPMGDPLQVMVRGVSIAIRNHVASKIEVK